jgi:hypothetical protein
MKIKMKCVQAKPLKNGSLSIMMQKELTINKGDIKYDKSFDSAYLSFTTTNEKEVVLFKEGKFYSVTIKSEK